MGVSHTGLHGVVHSLHGALIGVPLHGVAALPSRLLIVVPLHGISSWPDFPQCLLTPQSQRLRSLLFKQGRDSRPRGGLAQLPGGCAWRVRRQCPHNGAWRVRRQCPHNGTPHNGIMSEQPLRGPSVLLCVEHAV